MNYQYAFLLENIVRDVYGCGRFGLSGMASADLFQQQPFLAAELIVAYAYASGKEFNPDRYRDFLEKYSNVVDDPLLCSEIDMQEYVKCVREIADDQL